MQQENWQQQKTAELRELERRLRSAQKELEMVKQQRSQCESQLEMTTVEIQEMEKDLE
jgi:SMC interacting uncharacterized protein involved in chromosome segregation